MVKIKTLESIEAEDAEGHFAAAGNFFPLLLPLLLLFFHLLFHLIPCCFLPPYQTLTADN